MWHYTIDDVSTGPCEEADIASVLIAGKINGQTPVWSEGMAGWLPLEQTALAKLIPPASPAPAAAPKSEPNFGFEKPRLKIQQPTINQQPEVNQPLLVPQTRGRESSSTVNPGVIRELVATKLWVRFMAVLAFIISGYILFIAARFVFHFGISAIIAVLWLLIPSLIYLIPACKLWGYGNAINRLAEDKSPQSLEEAMALQHQFWRFVAVVTAIVALISLVRN